MANAEREEKEASATALFGRDCLFGLGEKQKLPPNRGSLLQPTVGYLFRLTSERVVGFEPTTTCLGSRCATTAPHPLTGQIIAHSPFQRKSAHLTFAVMIPLQ
jgi:hypothetical protein